MKNGIRNIIGKTVIGVVVGENKGKTRRMVNLVFSDGAHFEFYGSDVSCAGDLDVGGVEEVIAYIESIGGKVTLIY